MQSIFPDFSYEKKLWRKDYYVIGIDEVGRGALAGPCIGLKNQLAIVHGDEKSISIAAASIIAKVERDRTMSKLHQDYPKYGWKKNKGYGTKKHIEVIKKYGKSKLHRELFLRKIIIDK